jgi:hypothetical protein
MQIDKLTTEIDYTTETAWTAAMIIALIFCCSKLKIPANLTNGSSSKNEEQDAETSAQAQSSSR